MSLSVLLRFITMKVFITVGYSESFVYVYGVSHLSLFGFFLKRLLVLLI